MALPFLGDTMAKENYKAGTISIKEVNSSKENDKPETISITISCPELGFLKEVIGPRDTLCKYWNSLMLDPLDERDASVEMILNCEEEDNGKEKEARKEKNQGSKEDLNGDD